VAEEVENPTRNIRKGYLTGMATLVFLALGVMILTGGITDWRKLSALDYPLPEAISFALGKTSSLTKIFASIGLFGLIASFHAIILASSRQVFALARSGYLPRFLSTINHKFKTPHWSMIAGGVVSFIALYSGTTGQVVILSVMGAIVMYIMSMASLFILRVNEPNLERPFASPFYPLFPVIACIILVVTMVAIIYYQPQLSLIFFAGLIVAIIIFMLMGKHKVKIENDALLDNPSIANSLNH